MKLKLSNDHGPEFLSPIYKVLHKFPTVFLIANLQSLYDLLINQLALIVLVVVYPQFVAIFLLQFSMLGHCHKPCQIGSNYDKKLFECGRFAYPGHPEDKYAEVKILKI